MVGDRPIDFRYGLMSLPGAPVDPVGCIHRGPGRRRPARRPAQRRGVRRWPRPRTLRSPAAARNEVRRNILGIRRFRDVKIPLRNGSFVYADVFRPDSDEPVPVVMNCGVYGRAFVHHSDLQRRGRRAPRGDGGALFPRQSRRLRVREPRERQHRRTGCPRGYALVRVDGPGAGKSPGTLGVWGIDEARGLPRRDRMGRRAALVATATSACGACRTTR